MKFINKPDVLSTSAADLLPARAISRWQHATRLATAVAAAAGLIGAPTLHATVYTWTGGGADNNWTTSANFTPAGPATGPGTVTLDDIVFNTLGAAKTTSNVNNFTVGAGTDINSITFAAGSPTYTITSTPGTSELFLDAGGITNNANTTEILALSDQSPGFGGIYLANFGTGLTSTSFTANAGTLLINSDITFGSITTLVLTGSHTIIINGVINDSGVPEIAQVIKTGTGTAILNGQNTYLGNTTVDGGLLLVNGAIASQQTFTNPGGTLGGNGVIGGNVYNSGTVAPGVSPTDASSTLTVKGTYNQASNGTLAINVNGTQSNKLAVQGAANLNGTLRLTQVGGGRLNVGQKVTFLTAAGGVSGSFSNVSNGLSNGTIINDQVIYSSNSVAVEAQQGSFKSFAQGEGLSPNQVAVAGGLDHVAFHNQQPRLIAYLDNEPLSKLPGDFEKISPDQLTSVFTTGVALANVQTANLQRRTDDIRSGSNGFSAAGFQTAGSGPYYSGGWGVAGPTGDDGKESKEMKNVVPAPNRVGVFITGTGEWVNVNGGGFTVGADYRVTDNFAVGIDAGYDGTSSDLHNTGRIYTNGGKLGLYATYFTGGFYVDSAVNGGYNSYSTRRDALQGTARGDTDGGELNVLYGTGYDFHSGGWTFGPTANFQYTDIGINSFNEHGSLAPLNFHSQSQDSLRTAFGAKASYDWKVGGVVIKPEVSAAWQHEYGDTAYALDSSFSNGNGDLFTVNGPKLGRDSLLVGAGFAIMWNERTSTYVYYDGELARTNYNAQNVSAGIRLSF
jgi:autotransporter-associated beta strand protein